MITYLMDSGRLKQIDKFPHYLLKTRVNNLYFVVLQKTIPFVIAAYSLGFEQMYTALLLLEI